MSLIEYWPTASCCGELRVTRHVDRCYDHAKVCATCDEPSEDGICPACQLRGAVARITELEAENARLRRDRLELENMEITRLREGSKR